MIFKCVECVNYKHKITKPLIETNCIFCNNRVRKLGKRKIFKHIRKFLARAGLDQEIEEGVIGYCRDSLLYTNTTYESKFELVEDIKSTLSYWEDCREDYERSLQKVQ